MEDMRCVGAALAPFFRAENIDNVPDFLKAYMMFLFGFFSAAAYDLNQRGES
jgi:hypothetical protein